MDTTTTYTIPAGQLQLGQAFIAGDGCTYRVRGISVHKQEHLEAHVAATREEDGRQVGLVYQRGEQVQVHPGTRAEMVLAHAYTEGLLTETHGVGYYPEFAGTPASLDGVHLGVWEQAGQLVAAAYQVWTEDGEDTRLWEAYSNPVQSVEDGLLWVEAQLARAGLWDTVLARLR